MRFKHCTVALLHEVSKNQIMFEHFSQSMGVANIRRFDRELKHQPHYITLKERGAGFAEVAQGILASPCENL